MKIRYNTKINLALIVSFFLVEPIFSQWSSNPLLNNAISTATQNQSFPKIVSDGSGGAIITWTDSRGSDNDIYAQRISSAGVTLWTNNGIVVSSAIDEQAYSIIVSDGTGGAIIAWRDLRNGSNYDIYAQRINASGIVQWAANGISVCAANGNQDGYKMVADGAGGAIITWSDLRLNQNNNDIYAQKINAQGFVQWTLDGEIVCNAANFQVRPSIVSDANGGAVISWEDFRTGQVTDIYAQRISLNGNILWTNNGVSICNILAGNKQKSNIISSGGEFLISWVDNRGADADIYVQKINLSGIIQWPTNGTVICSETSDQIYAAMVSDGSGGVIISWTDYRYSDSDIYAQFINSSGTIQWNVNGIIVCNATGIQEASAIVSDGNNGAIITWEDQRAGIFNPHIYAQRINNSGVYQWLQNGVAICTALDYQSYPDIISDNTGAIITWRDYRVASHDIYAQKININGILGGAANLVEINTSQLIVYPNPSNGILNIQLPYYAKIIINNILGEEVLVKELNIGNQLIDIQNLSKGIYFLNVFGEKNQILKFIKE